MRLKVPLLLLVMLLASARNSAGSGETVKDFWQTFKRSVITRDKDAVARLSRFPIGMSYGKRSIRTRAEFIRRYAEVFNEQSDAAQCFDRKEPEIDPQNPKRFSIACPDEAGNEVVIYEFERGRQGWKFVRLDNINE